MAGRGSGRGWQDIHLMIASSSVALLLGLWNLLAGPDRAAALERAAEEQARAEELARQQALEAQVSSSGPAVVAAPSAPGETKLLLGGQAPQTRIVVQGGGRGGGGRGGGGGGAATSTRSS